MSPVGAVALGLLVALLDLRVSGFDVLPDVVGWVLVSTGLGRLARLDPRFQSAHAWALVTTVLSLADLVHPQVTTTTGAMTTTADAAPAGVHGWLVSAFGAAGVVVAVLLCRALRDRARRAGDAATAELFTTFAFLHAVTGAVLLAGAAAALLTTSDGTIEATGALGALTLVVVVGALVLQVCFLLALRGVRDRPWLQEPAPPVRAPLG